MADAGQAAFRTLVDCRRWMQRSGIDRLAQRHGRFWVALRAIYRAAYRALQPSGMITTEIRGMLVSIDPGQRDLALLLRKGEEWERHQTLLFESLLSEGMVFVDIGAHIGYYTLLAAQCVGACGKVYAFEPAPDNFRVLTRNIEQNALTNVVAESVAVARSSGRASFTLSDNDSSSHSLAGAFQSGRRVEVETISLDEYFSEYEGRIDIVKLDAEGAELAILEGMQQALARNPEMVLFTEIYPRAMEAFGNSPEAFLAKLAHLGFSVTPFEEVRPAEEPLALHDFPAFLDDLRARNTGANLLCRQKEAGAKIATRRAEKSFADADPVTDSACPPLISVAIPTHNRGALLERALQSVLSQVAKDIEIVVYDTGSTDDTAERMARLSAGNPALRFVAVPERRSLDETLLLLLEVCRGEYVWFFSSDDRMKPGAVDAVRRRILNAGKRPALVYVNQEITDEAGRTLIASHVGHARDRDFLDGRKIVPWLALNLGFISASLIRRKSALRLPSAREFIGTRSLNLRLYLGCLLEGGAAMYVGEPLIQARRASGHPPYEYRDVFVRGIVRIMRDARSRGFGFLAVYRTMHRVVAGQYLRLVVSWRADDPAELAHTFPSMFDACWMYPAFWLLVVPARFTPRWLVRGVRNRMRRWRQRCNEAQPARAAEPLAPAKSSPTPQSDALRGMFRALVLARKLIAAVGADRAVKLIPFIVVLYRRAYVHFRPRQTIRTEFRGHTVYVDLTDTVVVRSLVTSGEWERYESRLFSTALEDGMVAVDIGANIGLYTLEAAQKVGSKGTVIAFEPEPHNFDLLCRNIEANHFRNVTPVRKALSSQRGVARLAISADNLGAHHIETSPSEVDSIEVETLSLDEYFCGRPSRIDVIKMDAEGAEMSILRGMRGLLDANPHLILFTEFSPGAIRASGHDPEEYLQELSALGFQLGIVDQKNTRIEALSVRQVPKLIGSLLREDHGRFYLDLLCIRGRAIQGSLGPHTWWQRPVFESAARAGRG
jgi:FkbM family methyltransferase